MAAEGRQPKTDFAMKEKKMNSEVKNNLLSDEEAVEEALDTIEEIDAIADLVYDYGIDVGLDCEPEAVREEVFRAVLAGRMEPSVALTLYCWYLGIGNGYVVKAANLFADFDECEAAKAQLDAAFQGRDIAELLDYLLFQASR